MCMLMFNHFRAFLAGLWQFQHSSQVVMVVHQPRYSLFTLFDEVLLLGGGQTVYLGPSEGALPYFRNLGFKMPQHEHLASEISCGEKIPRGHCPLGFKICLQGCVVFMEIHDAGKFTRDILGWGPQAGPRSRHDGP